MHFTKAARQWWASLKTQGTHPRTWKLCRSAIMEQFLTEDARDEVLTAWRGLKLKRGESIQQYINKFWDLHLKAIVFKKIDFAEQRQQYCAGLTEDIRSYVNDQKPRSDTNVKDFVNNGCMFLLVISHFLIHVVTHASVHMTHDEGRKFLEPTPPRKVFYYLCS